MYTSIVRTFLLIVIIDTAFPLLKFEELHKLILI